MSNTPLKATLGICVSLASHLAFAETAPVHLMADVPAHSYARVVDALAAPQQAEAAAQPDHVTENALNIHTAGSTSAGQMSGLQDLSPTAVPAEVVTTIQTAPTAPPIQSTDATIIIASGDPANPQVSGDTATTTEASAPATDSSTDTSTNPLNRIGQTLGYSIDKIGELGAKIAVNANAAQPDPIKDPFEHFNRAMWSFNSKLDKYILLPVANAYVKVVPQVVRTGVTNFFSNLGQPWTAVNNLLQGHPGTSVQSLSRFVINTVTTLGFYDTAGYLGIPKSTEDFGQTLGVWGVGSGPFLMLPVLGPSTVRDAFAQVVDQVGYAPNYLDNSWEAAGVTVARVVNSRANLIGLEHFVEGDQYSLIRDVYLQNRDFQIHGAGNSGTPSADSFGDDGFGDDGAKAAVTTAPAMPQSSSPAKAPQPDQF